MYKSYGIIKKRWNVIRDDVLKNKLTNKQVVKKYELTSEQVWFLYDKLLQEKYNNLYTREKIEEVKIGLSVYCNYDGYGRGKIVKLLSGDMMLVKFTSRDLNTMCSSKHLHTIHDEIKRKVTRL